MSFIDKHTIQSQIENFLPNNIKIKDTDNLLKLGLDSLKIFRLISLWRKEGSDVTFARLMKSPYLPNWINMIQESHIQKEKDIAIPSMNEPFELTDLQYAYWIGRRSDQLVGNVSCHAYMEFDGNDIDIKKLEKAFSTIIQHHPMLHIRILEDGLQVVDSFQEYHIITHDLTTFSENQLDKALLDIRNKLSHRKMDVEHGEVVSLQVSLLPQNKTRIHFESDGLVADVHSLFIILRDLEAAYARGSLPPAPINWNFAHYLKTINKKKEIARKEDEIYWKKKIHEMPGAPALPLCKQPEQVKNPRFFRRQFSLSPTEWKNLQKYAANYGLTPAMVILTAYALIISRWSSNDKFLINIPLFDRETDFPGAEDAVADFSNLLLLAIDFSIPLSFIENAQNIQKQFHQDIAHTAYSGVRVYRDIVKQVPEEKMPAPIVFAYNVGQPLFPSTWINTIGKGVYFISQTPQVWLDCQIFDTDDGGLIIAWDAVEELFFSEMLDAMHSAYSKLLHELSDSISYWNKIPNTIPQNQLKIRNTHIISRQIKYKNIHSNFFENATKFPNKIAIIDGETGMTWSYAELAHKSLQVAQLLRTKRVLPNEGVIVTLPRGPEQIAAVLGVLAAGAYYIPISANQPKLRWKNMLQQVNANYILTTYDIKDIPQFSNINYIYMEDAEELYPIDVPYESSQNSLAYVIFTSGSTGIPKGVAIEHFAVWNTLETISTKFNINSSSRVLAVSSLDFDLSVFDIFGMLSVGGSIVTINDHSWRDAAVWNELIDTYQITIWNSVPILFKMLLSVSPKQLPLKLVILSGDWIPLDIPNILYDVAPICKLIAMGGATEASIWSNYQEVNVPIPEHWTSIPYGFPLDNQFYRVVDSSYQDCPDFTPGELWIGGMGLAKEYIGDPKLTEKKFVFSNGTRWYRTGDRGRFWPDGTIEFLGREDAQVKIRGHRIELGEIESTIHKHKEIRDAVAFTFSLENNTKNIGLALTLNPFPINLIEKNYTENMLTSAEWSNIINNSQNQSPRILQSSLLDIWNKLNELYEEAIKKAFTELNIFTHPQESYSITDIINKCKILPRYDKWLMRALLYLKNKNILNKNNNIFTNIKPLKYDKKHFYSIINYIETNSKDFIDFTYDEINLAYIIPATYLSSFLKGDKNTSEIYTDKHLPQMYAKMFTSTYKVAQKTINNIVHQHRIPKRVLEIGSGIGTFTRHILPIFPQETEYFYTDVSPYFFESAKKEFSDYNIKYNIFNMDIDPVLQGYQRHSFDLIIAASVLHVGKDLRKILSNIKNMLTPGGILLIIEETIQHYPFELTMGLQQGWDNYEDYHLRKYSPLISEKDWNTLFSECKYTQSNSIMINDNLSNFFGFHIIIAEGPKEIDTLSTKNIKSYLQDRLPDYMIPSLYLHLDQIPLTTNGKINRSLLSQNITKGDDNNEKTQKHFATTQTEKIISQIWSETLNISDPDCETNFFMLGGDSLLATKLIVKIKNTFNINIKLDALFENQTIRHLASFIDNNK